MGNRLGRKSSSAVCPGDACKSKQSMLNERGGSSSYPSASPKMQVKIRITKKQLEQLIEQVEDRDVTARQIVSLIMDAGDRFKDQHQEPWRAALESVPEVN
ncbi:hypothetical protein NMG60_11022539 [Bertholletia excelsa]